MTALALSSSCPATAAFRNQAAARQVPVHGLAYHPRGRQRHVRALHASTSTGTLQATTSQASSVLAVMGATDIDVTTNGGIVTVGAR